MLEAANNVLFCSLAVLDPRTYFFSFMSALSIVLFGRMFPGLSISQYVVVYMVEDGRCWKETVRWMMPKKTVRL